MNTTFGTITSACLIGGALILGGCTSSDDGGGTVVPPNAVTITSLNATPTVTAAIASADIVFTALGAEVVQAPSAMDIVNLVEELRKNRSGANVLNTPTGITESYPCSGGGTTNYNYTSTDTSESGSIAFSNCNEFGFTLNGTLSYSRTWTNPYGPYSDHVSGNITADTSGFVTTISNLNFTNTGVEVNDYGDAQYTINPFNYSINFTGGGGFAVSLLAPVTGDDTIDSICPLTGTILVTGAGNTKAKGTIDYPYVDISFDNGSGAYTPVETVSCYDVFQ